MASAILIVSGGVLFVIPNKDNYRIDTRNMTIIVIHPLVGTVNSN